MGKTAKASESRKYGVPFYGASWVPPNILRSDSKDQIDGAGDQSSPSIATDNYLIFAGGGGEGRSGIPNALVLSQFDFASNSLSDQPVEKLETGGDLPYRMAVHPSGEGVVCSLSKDCRRFEWDETKSNDVTRLSLKLSEKVLDQLEDVGQQLAITFSNDGSVLAVGGEDGMLRAFKWPSMESILNVAKAHGSVKDIDFSPDGKFIVSVGSGGPGRVWDLSSSMAIASLTKENDEVFGFCRFSNISENNQVLYVTAMRGQGGYIVKWDTKSWTRIVSKRVTRDPISAFNVSADGKLLAIGTIQGDILILDSANMWEETVVRKAHLGLVTTLMFSEDSRALVSASLDSSARVTQIIDSPNRKGANLWIIVLTILLAIALYYATMEGTLLQKLQFFNQDVANLPVEPGL